MILTQELNFIISSKQVTHPSVLSQGNKAQETNTTLECHIGTDDDVKVITDL